MSRAMAALTGDAGPASANVLQSRDVDVADVHSTVGCPSPMAIQLARWRRAMPIQQAKAIVLANQKQGGDERLLCAILCSGGCLDTLAAIRAGFTPKWSSEVCPEQARMFEDLTGGVCLGDTFGLAVKSAQWVHYWKSGQPCPNYACSGDLTGEQGETGWMFVKQTEVILEHLPWAFCLEISDNAPFVNGGAEVTKVRERLAVRYVIYGKTLKVWHYGDPSNRKRLFMVGMLKELGQVAMEFVWPTAEFSEGECVPIARCIGVPDAMVEPRYQRQTRVPAEQLLKHTEEAHRLQVVARLGRGMGFSANPNTVLSWNGLLNGQTIWNGGGQRPKLSWVDGTPINGTRLTVPVETVRAASLDDSVQGGYAEWAGSFARADEDLDDFIRRCVNNGVPLRTSTAIDRVVYELLEKHRKLCNAPTAKWASLCWQSQPFRRMLFDTGANGHLNFRDVEHNLTAAQKALGCYTVANKQELDVGMTGNLAMIVVNSGGHAGVPEESRLDIRTTTADVSYELFSFDPLYRSGWGCDIQPHNEGGAAFLYKRSSDGMIRIPLNYNWEGGGGFWLEYMLVDPESNAHRALLASHQADIESLADIARRTEVPVYDAQETRAWQEKATGSGDVVDVWVAQHAEDRVIRGTKAGLRSKQQKQPILEFHDDYGHLGCAGSKKPCLICKLVKGAMRRIMHKVDPHKETRPGFKWHMDTVTWSHRSAQGNKYMTVLRDEASDYYVAFCHYLRNDIVTMLEVWLQTVRADPAYGDCRYKLVAQICLDNAGEWSRECEAFGEFVKQGGIGLVYSCPDRKESAALAERAVGIVEIVVKALLMQNSLPPWWWEHCTKGAVFLLNRFPTAKLDNMSLDGDAPRPLELFSRFSYSRRQIDRELSYWVAPGTPALVQTTAKGSELGPKTRWGVAIEMYREQVVWMCPYRQSTFASKSFAAFKLVLGMNYAQWLGLEALEPTNKAAAIPIDFKEKLVVQLPSDDWHAVQRQAEAQEALVGDQQAVAQGACAEKLAPPKSIVEMKVAGSMAGQPPTIRVVEPNCELGGSVQLEFTAPTESAKRNRLLAKPSGMVADQDSAADQLELASKGLNESEGAPSELGAQGSSQRVQGLNTGSDQVDRECYVDMAMSPETIKWLDEIDRQKVQHKALTTDGSETFVRVCKRMDLAFEVHGIYRQWLIDSAGFEQATLPVEGRAKLRCGLVMPYPSGSHWQDLLERGSRKARRANRVDYDANALAEINALHWVSEQISSQRAAVEAGSNYSFSVQHGKRALAVSARDFAKMRSKAQVKKKKSDKAVAAGRKPNPKDTREALSGEDAEQWVESMGIEFYGLIQMGVFELGFTQDDLIAEGITSPPVPCAPYYEYKYGVEGEVSKLKTRVAIQGHPGNMQKGVHFDRTFSATPQEATSRIMSALVVAYNLHQAAFDITKAFCWAELPLKDQIAVCYPEGFKKADKDGKPLYMILRKNLYGRPDAGRLFGQQRDATLLDRFNKGGWQCKSMRMDPCLFLVTRDYSGVKQWALLLIHVDDCDIAGTSQTVIDDVMRVCKTIWDCSEVDPGYMLGVRRRVDRDTETGQVHSIELDMVAFVEGMYRSFEDRMGGRSGELRL